MEEESSDGRWMRQGERGRERGGERERERESSNVIVYYIVHCIIGYWYGIHIFYIVDKLFPLLFSFDHLVELQDGGRRPGHLHQGQKHRETLHS